ncbi:MAG: tetratricopeptide repeat protein, partial [bacterium]|nr:tetratricopeptide repeat protein [bacterium]
QALAYGTEALEQLEEWGDDEHKRKLFSALTWIYYADGDYEAGLRYGKEFEQMARASGDQRALLRSLRAIAFNQEGAGAWGPALETFNEALALSQKLDDYQLGGILTSIGDVYQSLGDLEESVQYHHRAYRHFEHLGDRPLGVAVALSKVADLYTILGRHDQTIEFYGRVLEILQELGDQRRSALALGSIGDAYRDSGDPSRALELHLQSLVILEQLGLQRRIAAVLGNIGADQHAMGDL